MGQINDLESKVEQLEEDLAQRGGKKGNKNSENLPKPVARHELQGFRGVVTNVRFHPVIAVVVGSGEDGTVKVAIVNHQLYLDTLSDRYGTTRVVNSSDPCVDTRMLCNRLHSIRQGI